MKLLFKPTLKFQMYEQKLFIHTMTSDLVERNYVSHQIPNRRIIFQFDSLAHPHIYVPILEMVIYTKTKTNLQTLFLSDAQ